MMRWDPNRLREQARESVEKSTVITENNSPEPRSKADITNP